MNQKITKTVLAFDTAMAGIAVGVVGSNGHIVSRQVETQREQASLLIPVIQEVLEEAQLAFSDIDVIGCSVGPGSFTGLRIGLTTAKTLALSLDAPLVGLNTLEVMAHHYSESEPLLIVLETKRKDFYAQYFDSFDTGRTALCDPFSALDDEVLNHAPVAKFNVGGDCLERFQENAPTELNLLTPWLQPDPIIMAQLAFNKFEAGAGQARLEPIYLRDADVSMPKNLPRKLASL